MYIGSSGMSLRLVQCKFRVTCTEFIVGLQTGSREGGAPKSLVCASECVHLDPMYVSWSSGLPFYSSWERPVTKETGGREEREREKKREKEREKQKRRGCLNP